MHLTAVGAAKRVKTVHMYVCLHVPRNLCRERKPKLSLQASNYCLRLAIDTSKPLSAAGYLPRL